MRLLLTEEYGSEYLVEAVDGAKKSHYFYNAVTEEAVMVAAPTTFDELVVAMAGDKSKIQLK